MSENLYPKANVLNRFIAKFIDLLIVAIFYELSSRVGFIAGMMYLLIGDGFSQGKSVGKWLIGLQTYVPARRSVCTFRESIIRNFPLAVAYFLFLIPYMGWLLTVGIMVFESLMMIGNGQGLRVGDEIGGTQVLEQEVLDVGVER
ncbi:MAG: hypothetical protein L0Y56_09070 [Nitrospira sp.]|nr:hypothetical protein [Nitrospira sp.]